LQQPHGYPVHFEADVVLSDGGTVLVRPIRPDDAPALARLHERLSPQSVYLRYFSPHPHLSDTELAYLTNLDYRWRMAIVAVLGDEIVGVARYEGEEGKPAAEVAFVVDDRQQGRGIGTVLLEWLAAAAREAGISEFYATTLWENQKMLGVFREAGFQTKLVVGGGEVAVRFPVADSTDLAVAIAKREHAAEARSVGRLLAPRSIAVIGAGHDRSGIGHRLFKNLLAGDFQGIVYPVNPKSSHIGGVRAYASVMDIPDDVDLALIAVPAAVVPEVVNQCAAKNVGGLVIISAGFAEVGGEGVAVERDLVRLAHRHGMRVVGPNSVGVINLAPGVAMNATFAATAPLPGRVALCSQSGGIGVAALERSARLGLGVSSFVSVGNKADVSSNDLLQYWEDDVATDVILLYLESFGNPGKFHRIARRVAGRKPIVAVKGGRSQSGTRGASSHTAAAAAPDRAVDALFGQTGVIRVDTLEQLFDTAAVLAHQPLPAGDRVAIAGNSGGPALLAADACEAAGLVVPELSAETQGRLRSVLPPAAGVRNPVDMLASAGPDTYGDVLRILLGDADVDAVIAVWVPTPDAPAGAVAAAITELAGGPWNKPLVANLVGVEGIPEPVRGDRAVPCFPFPETAAQSLARAVWYGQWRRRPVGQVPSFAGIDLRQSRRVAADFLSRRPDGGWLDAPLAGEILAGFGIPVGPPAPVDGTAGAAPGVEMMAGVARDPSFGPLVMFGLGGVAAELVGDTALKVAPLTDQDAAELVRGLRSSPLLFGYRGSPPVDAAALEEVLLRLSVLGEQLPELAELDLNPLIAAPDSVTAGGWRLRLAPAERHPERELRRLR
jgi:acetyl coenzyme A synthetase (ADP forming)-like protein